MSFSDGSVALYKCDRRQERLIPTQQWAALHAHQFGGVSNCTSLSVSQDGSVVTAGEDNKICQLSVESTTPLRTVG